MAKKDLNYNWALDYDFATAVSTNLMTIWEMVRNARAQREMVWMESYRGWTVDRLNTDNNYVGRANLYWPQIRKEVETMTRRMMKGIFTDDYLRAVSEKFEDEDITIANTQVVSHFLDHVMKFPVAAEPWIKQNVLYGTSPLRTFWRKDVNQQFIKERSFKDRGDGLLVPTTNTVMKDITTYNGPVARAEDIFQTWVYPHNVQDQKEFKAVFTRTKLTWEELLQRANVGMAVGITPQLKHQVDEDIKKGYEKAKDQGTSFDIDYPRGLERLMQFADPGSFEAIQNDKYYDLHEVWTRLTLPDTEVSVPVVVEILNYQYPVRIQRNPFWHQSVPLDFARFIKPPPGEYYGRGLPEAVLPMQAQLNDLLNQGMDSATLALNNITIINPAFAPNAESFEVEPGAQWFADPAGVKQFVFPDLSGISIKSAETVRSVITQMSDNSPQLPDPIAGKARSSGQAQLAIDQWSTDLFSFLRSISADCLSPFAKKIHILCQQNLSDDDIIKVAGKYSGKWISRVISPDDILGDYSFNWITTLEIQEQQVKIQQMLNFVKVFAQIPPDQQAKIKFNWENYLLLLLRHGFMIKDTNTIIETPRETASTDPHLENRIIILGGNIMTTDSDDDNSHIAEHKIAQSKQKNKYVVSVFDQHIQAHLEQIKSKQAEAQKAQMQAQMQMAAMQAGQKPGPQSNKPGGNPGQLSESTNAADLGRGLPQG